MGLAIRKAKKSSLEMALSKSEAKKAAEDAAAEEDKFVWRHSPLGVVENQMRGHQQYMWCKI